MTGGDIERELRRQRAERDGSGKMSTALAEAVISWVCGPHLDEDPADILELFGDVVRKMIGPIRDRRLRDIIIAAQKTRGRRVIQATHVFWYRTQEEFDAECARYLDRLAAEAAAEHENHRRGKAETGRAGGRPTGAFDVRLRDALVRDAATAQNPHRRLAQANAALAAAGFEEISDRTLRRVLKKK